MDIIKDFKIAVIGAGASGLSCVIELERIFEKNKENYNITVFEHTVKPAKKILATGNGRCNFCNKDLSPVHFHGNNYIINSVLKSEFNNTEEFFKTLGVLSATESTRVYPRSFNANSVRDALLNNVHSKIITEYEIKNITKSRNGYLIDGEFFNVIIFACGGVCAASQGSDGSIYKHIENLGHTFTKLKPALTALTSGDRDLKEIKGIRAIGSVKLLQNNKEIACEVGEIQFTDKAISGIPVFDLSYLYDENRKNELLIDVCNDLTNEEIKGFLKAFTSDVTVEDALSGIVPKKLGYIAVNRAKIPQKTSILRLSDKSIDTLCGILKGLKFTINGTRSFNESQVTCGGINSGEIFSETLMSKRNNGMFFCGEILDVNGDCGGYNLHFAFTSGRKAASGVYNYLKEL